VLARPRLRRQHGRADGGGGNTAIHCVPHLVLDVVASTDTLCGKTRGPTGPITLIVACVRGDMARDRAAFFIVSFTDIVLFIESYPV
jgi:hypothetical protein